MQFLFRSASRAPAYSALWMCQRCLLSTQAQVPPTPPHRRRYPRKAESFFVARAITPETKENVKSLQGDIPLQQGLKIYNYLKEQGKLHWSLYSTYIIFLLNHKQYDDAIQTMREASAQKMIHPHLYNRFLSILFTENKHDMAFSFLKDVGYTPYAGNVERWMQVLMEPSYPDGYTKAMELADFLIRNTTTPVKTAYTTIFLKTLRTTQPVDKCFEILRIYTTYKEKISKELTMGLLEYIISHPHPEQHLRQMAEITSQDIFIKVANQFAKFRADTLLVKFFEVIHRSFPNVEHDFFRAIGLACFARLWSAFVGVIRHKFDEEKKELKLEEFDSTFLSALATQPAFGELLLARMVSKGVTVDAIYFEFQIESGAGLPADAEALFAQWYCRAMTKYGVRPSRAMNDYVVCTFLKEEKYARAREVFLWMLGEELDVGGIHLNFARFHVHHKEPEKAIDILVNEALEAGIQPSMEDCDTLVDMLGREGHMKAARRMCMQMQRLRMRPSLNTQLIMLRNTLKHDGLDDGFILFDRLYSWQLTPDRAVYELLLKQSIEDKRWEKLDELRQHIRRDKILFDLQLHNQFLEGYLKAGNSFAAEEIVLQLASLGYNPNLDTYRILLLYPEVSNKILANTKWLFNTLMDQPTKFVPRLKVHLAKAFLATDQLHRGFYMARELAVLQAEVSRDLFDVLCFTACYGHKFALLEDALIALRDPVFLRDVRSENFLPSPSVITMVMDRMAQAKFDSSHLAAAYGVTAPTTAFVSTPDSPPTVDAPPLSNPFADLFPPSPNATSTTSSSSPDSPLSSSPTPAPYPLTPTSSPSFTPSNSLPPTARIMPPHAATSSTLSPSSAPSSTLSRNTAFEFRDDYAHLRPAHAGNLKKRAEFETRQKRGLFKFYFGEKEEEEEHPADPFKEYAYVVEEGEEGEGTKEQGTANETEIKVTEKRNSRLRELFLSLKLW